MKNSKLIKKANDLAEYEIDETNKEVKGVTEKIYNSEKKERRGKRWKKRF